MPEKAWDLIALGSDFDGFIDPANGFSTSLDFEKFHDRLVAELNKTENRRYWLDDLTPMDIANKICFDNAFQFMEKHFKSF